jgi:hypothetical protein
MNTSCVHYLVGDLDRDGLVYPSEIDDMILVSRGGFYIFGEGGTPPHDEYDFNAVLGEDDGTIPLRTIDLKTYVATFPDICNVIFDIIEVKNEKYIGKYQMSDNVDVRWQLSARDPRALDVLALNGIYFVGHFP